MTDVVVLLKRVEAAAEKATKREWMHASDGSRSEVWGGRREDGKLRSTVARVPRRDDAEFIVAACNLPFRAVREELERLRRVEAAARGAAEYAREVDMRAASVQGGFEYLPDALSAVLCSDPAGGEG